MAATREIAPGLTTGSNDLNTNTRSKKSEIPLNHLGLQSVYLIASRLVGGF